MWNVCVRFFFLSVEWMRVSASIEWREERPNASVVSTIRTFDCFIWKFYKELIASIGSNENVSSEFYRKSVSRIWIFHLRNRSSFRYLRRLQQLCLISSSTIQIDEKELFMLHQLTPSAISMSITPEIERAKPPTKMEQNKWKYACARIQSVVYALSDTIENIKNLFYCDDDSDNLIFCVFCFSHTTASRCRNAKNKSVCLLLNFRSGNAATNYHGMRGCVHITQEINMKIVCAHSLLWMARCRTDKFRCGKKTKKNHNKRQIDIS